MQPVDYFKANQAGTPGAWKASAKDDIEKYQWQKYSFGIAIKARRRMKEMGMTQKMLSERMGCTQQYISTLLKGKENLTLETIAKIERILNLDLLGRCIEFNAAYSLSDTTPLYLSEAEQPPYGSKKSEKE